MKERVKIEAHIMTAPNTQNHETHHVTLNVVKSSNNRYINSYGSIDAAVLYALNNNFNIDEIKVIRYH